MKVDFIGIGGAFVPQLGCNSAYIKEKNKILFIDFGMDTFSKVIKYDLLKNIEYIYIVLTHMHGDHIGGLFTFIDYCYYSKKIIVKIIKNSLSFTNKLVNLLDLVAIKEEKFELIESSELTFDFNLYLEKTTHTPLLECYSLVIEKAGEKILYTSDSNDFMNVLKKVNDESFVKIYCEVGENSPIHLEYEMLKKLDTKKLILMHFQSMELYERVQNEGFNTPVYLK